MKNAKEILKMTPGPLLFFQLYWDIIDTQHTLVKLCKVITWYIYIYIYIVQNYNIVRLVNTSIPSHNYRLGGMITFEIHCIDNIQVYNVALLLTCVQLFCNPMDGCPPGSSVHRISQARILESVAISFSRGSSQPRDQTLIPWLTGGFFTTGPPEKPLVYNMMFTN